MAAIVASQQHQGLWQQRRPNQVMHMSSIGMTSMAPSTSSAPNTTRPYQSNHIELTMPMFPPTSVPNAIPFQPGAYGFDLTAMNHYPVQQQQFSINFQPQVPQHPATYPGSSSDLNAPVPLVREARDALPSINRSPPVKPEVTSPIHSNSIYSEGGAANDSKRNPTDEESVNVSFATDVDCLMRAIQSKHSTTPTPQGAPVASVAPVAPVAPVASVAPIPQPVPVPQPPPVNNSPHVIQEKIIPEIRSASEGRSGKARKRYQCSMPNCNKSFYQKTHLEIHTRAHTGVKPFLCKEPSCGQRFSQLGNLKTHERRHTGERPYNCDICGKTFAQRGNVRAHKIVHQQIKPFTCKLDDCGKQFTQLGNLKSHQNKFHAQTLRFLTQKFSTIREGDQVSSQDKELWEYFALLYKNSNKGIKGRGKDRRISTIPSVGSSSSYTSAGTTTMSRNATNGSTQGPPSDRSSRSSSYVSAEQNVEPQHHPPARVGEAPNGYHYEDHSGYNNMVFPERKFV